MRAFCEPLDVVGSAYVGLTEIEEEFKYPREQLAVAFELARSFDARRARTTPRCCASPTASTTRCPRTSPAGGCNFIGPGAIAAWREKAWQVFAR